MTNKKRPWGIILASILLAIGGAISFLGALAIMFLGTALSMIPMTGFATGFVCMTALITIAIAIAELIVAYYLWNFKKWAWWIATILVALGVLSGIFSLTTLSLTVIFSLALNVIVIIGLISKDARKACKIKA